MNRKSYWFYLEPYVYVSQKGKSVFLYNTLNGESLEYESTMIIKLVGKMNTDDNLRVIELDRDVIDQNRELSCFIEDTRDNFMGDLIDKNVSPIKPAQMAPLLRLKRDAESTNMNSKRDIGQDIMNNLHEITIYVNNRCELNCTICNSAYKQFLCCFKNNKRNNRLSLSYIEEILSVADGCDTKKINIIGGNIFLYSDFDKLVAHLSDKKTIVSFHVHYKNLLNLPEWLKEFEKAPTLEVLINFPIEEDVFRSVLFTLNNLALDKKFNFIVAESADISRAQELIIRYNIDHHGFKPHFNGKNLCFFKENVFITKARLLDTRPSMKDIFKKEKVNLFNFGKLIILSNGDIHAGINNKKIGNIKYNSLHEAVYREVTEGRNWRMTRESIEPCKNCHFNLFCPSISNYEHILGKNNLCDIMDKHMGNHINGV